MFTILNVLALLILIIFIAAPIRNTVAYWVITYGFSLFLVLQLSAIYIGGDFIDYKYVTHFNVRDITAMKNLFLPRVLFLFVVLMGLPLALYRLRNRITQFRCYSQRYFRYSIILVSIVLMSFNQGVINNIYVIGKIATSQDSTFEVALHNLNINSYITSDKVRAERGKNIIIISLESFEKGYLSDAKAHLTPNMRLLAKNWGYFGMKETPGSGWTSASLYAVLTGLPCYFKGDGNSQFQDSYDSKIAGVGHVLENAGYEMTYLTEDAEFAGTEDLLRVFKISNVVDKRNIGKVYGDNFKTARDKDLFEAAKLEMLSKKADDNPFALFISTLDTHNPDGIYDSRFEGIISPQATQLEFMVASVDHMIGEFMEFLRKENVLENTTVYIFPDHLKMGDPSIFEGTGERNLYLLTNALNENLKIDSTQEIYQIDLPEIILNGAAVSHNVKFFTDYIVGDKIAFINNNVSKVTTLNNSGLKRSNIWEDEITVTLDNSKNGVVKFGKNEITIPEDTLKKFITRLSFSREMRLTMTDYINLENSLNQSQDFEYINFNVFSKGDTLFGYLAQGTKLPVLKSSRNFISFSKSDIQTISTLPSLSNPKESFDKLIVWEDNELIEINSSTELEYSEHGVQIPYNIKEGFIELEYITTGDAKPFIIAYGQPYTSASVVLHHPIPGSQKRNAIRLSFNRPLENTIFLFRNWSKRGKFIIYNYKIIGHGYDNDKRFETKTENFEAYSKDRTRFIAHAGGSIDGKIYTNSLEALDYNYERGFRLFELDISKTSDGKYVAAHDWKHWSGLTQYNELVPVTEEEFLKHQLLGKYTPLNMARINEWFRKHPDAILVTDKINEPREFAAKFIDRKRLMMELFTLDAVKQGLSIGIKSAMLSESVLGDLGKDRMSMLKKLGVKDIALSRINIASNVSFLQKLSKNGIRVYVFHVNAEANKDEKYVVSYEMDYIYGLYADNWDFK